MNEQQIQNLPMNGKEQPLHQQQPSTSSLLLTPLNSSTNQDQNEQNDVNNDTLNYKMMIMMSSASLTNTSTSSSGESSANPSPQKPTCQLLTQPKQISPNQHQNNNTSVLNCPFLKLIIGGMYFI